MPAMWSSCACVIASTSRLAPVVAVGEGIVEQLEEIYALAGAAVDVDQHVAVAGDLDQRRVPVPYIDESNLEVSHPVPCGRLVSVTASVMVQIASEVTAGPREPPRMPAPAGHSRTRKLHKRLHTR